MAAMAVGEIGSIAGGGGAGMDAAGGGGMLGNSSGVSGGMVLGPILGYIGSQFQNSQNLAFANAQTAFQSTEANSTYQRTMADMEKAGLNPILAMASGGGANPIGAQGQVPNQEAPISGAVSSAMQMLQLKGNLDEIDSRVKANAAASMASLAQADMNTSSARAVRAGIPLKEAEGAAGTILGPGIKKFGDYVQSAVGNSAGASQQFWDSVAEKIGNVLYGGKGGR